MGVFDKVKNLLNKNEKKIDTPLEKDQVSISSNLNKQTIASGIEKTKSSFFGKIARTVAGKSTIDPVRTRTCNLWFRRPTPYPLGHRTT